MVSIVTRSPKFIKQTKHLDKFLLEKLKEQINKILNNPEIGKPLRYKRGERCLYIKPFRLIYAVRRDEIILLNLVIEKMFMKNKIYFSLK